jgi:hypothetical protein
VCDLIRRALSALLVWPRLVVLNQDGVQCHASSVEFFESIPVPALPDDDESEVDFEPHEPEWLGPFSQLFGASVAVGGVVHRSEHLFVGIRGATAYPTGVSFHVEVAVRQGD